MANRSPGDSVAADSSTDRPGSIDHNWAAFFLMRRLCFWFPSLTYKSDELMKASVEFLPQSIGSWFSSAIITVPPPQLMDNNGLKVRTFHTTIDISSPPHSLPPSLPPSPPTSFCLCLFGSRHDMVTSGQPADFIPSLSDWCFHWRLRFSGRCGLIIALRTLCNDRVASDARSRDYHRFQPHPRVEASEFELPVGSDQHVGSISPDCMVRK